MGKRAWRRAQTWAQVVALVGAGAGCGVEATDVGAGREGADGAAGDAAGAGPGDAGGAGGVGGAGGAGGAGAGGAGGGPADQGALDAAADLGGLPEASVPVDAAAGADGAPPGDAGGPTPDPAHPCILVVAVGDLTVFAHEASRPDATEASAGTAPGVCSRPGVLPAATQTLAEARAACASADYRLCTDAEWRQACRGLTVQGELGTRAWPYGDQHQPGRCNEHLSGEGRLLPTGAKAECVTREGAHDLSGNLWERTDDGFRRGASYQLNAVMFRTEVTGCDAPFDVGPDFAADDLGFRCCK